ncbi:MAG: AAA family ATPase [Chloroflexi bacterium]|nr:AAA family ATPase [Chloroflexota bacterium]
MELIRFSVENYKSIRNAVMVDPVRRLNCLIGPNNEGKSSVLEALLLLRHLTTNIHENSAKTLEYMVERLPGKSRDNLFKIILVFSYSETDLDPSIGQSKDSLGTVTYTVCWGGQVEGGSNEHLNIVDVLVKPIGESTTPLNAVSSTTVGPTFSVSRLGLSDFLAQSGAGQKDQFNSNDITQRLKFKNSNCLSGEEWGIVKYLSWWASNLISVPPDRVIDPVAPINFAPVINRNSLPGMLLEMRTNREPEFKRFEKLICQLIPSIKQVHTYTEAGNETSIRVSEVAEIAAENAYRLDTTGTGVQEIFYLAASIWLSPNDSVLIIEEPERGLHPGSQRLLLNAVQDHAHEKNKQIFWTTHSTLMAPITQEWSVHLVAFSPDQTSAVTPIGIENDPGMVSVAIGQRMVDFYSHDLVLLYDGETENEVLPSLFDEVAGTEITRGIQFYNLRGDVSSKKELVRGIIESLSASPTDVFIFADNDPGVRESIVDLVKIFKASGKFTLGHTHLWECGKEEIQGAEFEDNFSFLDLIDAANNLAQSDKLNVEELQVRAEKQTSMKISKLLERYFYETYGGGWSKPELGFYLKEIALSKIQKDELRGHDGNGYEFEVAIKKVVKLIR